MCIVWSGSRNDRKQRLRSRSSLIKITTAATVVACFKDGTAGAAISDLRVRLFLATMRLPMRLQGARPLPDEQVRHAAMPEKHEEAGLEASVVDEDAVDEPRGPAPDQGRGAAADALARAAKHRGIVGVHADEHGILPG